MVDENVRIKITARDQATTVLNRVQSRIIAIGAAYMSWRVVSNVIKSIVSAGMASEKAWNDVAAALQRHNYQVDIALPLVKQVSDSMQTLTGVSDELVGKGIQRLIDANFSLDDAMATVRSSLDLAAGMNLDFRSATDLIAKSIDSSMNALTRYGIQIDKTADRRTQLKQLQDAIEGSFGGAAAARLTTAAGKLDLLNQKLGDLQEMIYALIEPAMRAALDMAIDWIDKLMKSFDDTRIKLLGGAIELFVRVQLKFLVDAVRNAIITYLKYGDLLITSIDNIAASYGALYAIITRQLPVAAGLAVIGSELDGIKQAYVDMLKAAGETTSHLASYNAEYERVAMEIAARIMGLNKKVTDNRIASINEIVDATEEATKQQADAVEDLLAIEMSRFDAIVQRQEATEEQLATMHAEWLIRIGAMDAEAAATWLQLKKEEIEQYKKALDKQEAVRERALAKQEELYAAWVNRIASLSSELLYYVSDRLLNPMTMKFRDMCAMMADHFKRWFIDAISRELAKAVASWLLKLALFDVAANDRMAMRSGEDYIKWFARGVNSGLTKYNFAGQLNNAVVGFGNMKSRPAMAGGAIIVNQYISGNVMEEQFVRQTIVPATERAVDIGASRIMKRSPLLAGNLHERFA